MSLRLAAELAAIRTDITNTKASFAETLRVQTWTIVTTMIGLTGIVFMIARFT